MNISFLKKIIFRKIIFFWPYILNLKRSIVYYYFFFRVCLHISCWDNLDTRRPKDEWKHNESGCSLANEILSQEDIYWGQKSWVTWLQDGERSTKFFHTSTLIRRRRNTITRFKLSGENWCEDPRALKGFSPGLLWAALHHGTV